jgi:hypothetical protein
MVLENVRAGLTCDVFGGAFRLGFLILSCHFELGSRDWDYLPNVHFSGDGAGGHCCKCPIDKLPIVGSISFSDTKLENGCWLK